MNYAEPASKAQWGHPLCRESCSLMPMSGRSSCRRACNCAHTFARLADLTALTDTLVAYEQACQQPVLTLDSPLMGRRDM